MALAVWRAKLTASRHMQDCFRAHPEMYASELEDDEVEEEIRAQDNAKAAASGATSQDEAGFFAGSAASEESQLPRSAPLKDSVVAAPSANPLAGDEGGDLVSKAVADAISAAKK